MIIIIIFLALAVPRATRKGSARHQLRSPALESLFICLSIDAIFVRIVWLGRVQGE